MTEEGWEQTERKEILYYWEEAVREYCSWESLVFQVLMSRSETGAADVQV